MGIGIIITSLLLVSISSGVALQGFDVSTPIDAQCLANEGYTFGSVRAWHSYGGFDPNAPVVLASILAAGMTGDVYLFPCPNDDPTYQMQSMITELLAAGSTFRWIWLDIETDPSVGCGWSTTNLTANCEFIGELIAAGQKLGYYVQIYSSLHQWTAIPGLSCTAGADAGSRIWYAHYDFNANCSDFSPFGGWTAPYAKQFSDRGSDCNSSYDINYVCGS